MCIHVHVSAFCTLLLMLLHRLERLRHHLMPLYNFDATDSGGDWEADLLEEERRQQQVRLRVDVSLLWLGCGRGTFLLTYSHLLLLNIVFVYVFLVWLVVPFCSAVDLCLLVDFFPCAGGHVCMFLQDRKFTIVALKGDLVWWSDLQFLTSHDLLVGRDVLSFTDPFASHFKNEHRGLCSWWWCCMCSWVHFLIVTRHVNVKRETVMGIHSSPCYCGF